MVDLGERHVRKRRKYHRNDARIARVVGRLAEYKEEQENILDGNWDGGLLKYLKTLGHSISRVWL